MIERIERQIDRLPERWQGVAAGAIGVGFWLVILLGLWVWCLNLPPDYVVCHRC